MTVSEQCLDYRSWSVEVGFDSGNEYVGCCFCQVRQIRAQPFPDSPGMICIGGVEKIPHDVGHDIIAVEGDKVSTADGYQR